ncbi:YciI family protein [Litoreibacter roseus]|uniref:YCII-related domain-containing protein n=1 Tax=Litoreibacter roseus TaxID=2601869 RepID=A0A6N6JHD0_9RHOB|nr:YciI family protein [Litoreibacter roseus]GFE64789.1 hypothetical protein KIN_18630 [Litoreibacter roseus]
MRVALICTDKPDSLDIRKANREAHLKHIADSGIVEMAGPLLNDAGDMAGSLLILEVEEQSQAQDWADADPYAKAGLFQDVRIQVWNKVVG